MAAHALACAPEECCGLVVEAASGVVVWPAVNQAPCPALAFEIPPQTLLAAASAGRVRAIYHSHPEGPAALSAADRAALCGPEGPLWPGVELWVAGLRGAVVDLARFAWDPGACRFLRLA